MLKLKLERGQVLIIAGERVNVPQRLATRVLTIQGRRVCIKTTHVQRSGRVHVSVDAPGLRVGRG